MYAAHYTPMQYRIWAEMQSGGLHDSMTTPPSTSMFVRARVGGQLQRNQLVVMILCHIISVSLHLH